MKFLVNKKQLALLIIFLVILFLPFISFAQINQHEIGYIPDFGLSGDASIEEIAGNIIQLFLGLLGFVMLVIIIISGFKWMTSGGNPEKITKAKKMLVAAVVGLVIILSSYIITVFLMRTFIEATNSDDNPGGGVVGCGNPGGCIGCSICGDDGNLHADDGCYNQCILDNPANIRNLHVSWKSPNGLNVDLCTMIQVGFNYDVNESSVNSNTFRVNKCNDGVCDQPVSGNFTVSGDVIQFKPSNNYDANSTYEVNLLTGGITSGEGENLISLLSSETWRFSTGATLNTQLPKVITTSILPSDDATEVCRNSNIKVKFSRDMDVLSLSNPSEYFNLFGRSDSGQTFSQQSILFNKKIYSADTLFLKPTSNYNEDFEYAPLFNGSVIKDSCGNSLDGNANNIADGFPEDNYPSNDNHDEWNFFTGKTLECKPELTNGDLSAYYDRGNLVIEGTYLEGASLMFNNEIAINSNSNFCMNNSGVAGVACSQASDWQEDKITIKVPAISGISNGAKSGDIKVITQYNKTLTTNFTLLSPRIDGLVSPNIGGRGQFITIRGQNFGEVKGNSTVYFRRNSQIVEARFPCESNSWKDNRIIISVPESINDLGSWDIQVKKVSDVSGVQEHWSNLAQFTLNNSNVGPGLCEVSPENVKFEDEFILTGKMLGTANGASRKVILGNQYTSQDAIVLEWLGETPTSQSTSVKAKTPNLQSGEVGVRVVIGEGTNALYSNFLSLNMLTTANQNLTISYIEPTSGPAGSYVTIHGTGFGKNKGNSSVEFKSINNQWVDGDFAFPAVCSANYWSDNRIIVKVPQDFENISTNSAIRVLVNGATSTEAVFQINTNLIPPSICSILPPSGIYGDEVSIFGEYFGDNPTAVFHYINNSGDEAQTTDTGDNFIKVVIPQTQTGLVAVRNENGYGNTVNFEYMQGSEVPTEVFDFYGWHFRTCETCGIPRVKMQTCSSTGNSSPSPFPGYTNVPLDMNIYVEFEYSDKTFAAMDESTLNTNNIKIYRCISDTDDNETEPDCDYSNPISISEITKTSNSVEINPSSNLDPVTIYKVSLSSNIKDFEGSNLISFDWFFRTGMAGGLCQANILKIHPDYGNVSYVSNKELSYFTQIWDTNGCYLCNNNYSYTWTKDDADDLVSFPVGDNAASSTKVKINVGGRFGELDINAKNRTFANLTDSTHLVITPNCSSFNDESDPILRQSNCITNGCCWNAGDQECLNEGNSVCNKPFIQHRNCINPGNNSNDEIIIGSPSPKSTNIYTVPTNANILARFTKRGGVVDMNEATYSFPGAIKIFRCNLSSQALDLNLCNEVTSSLGPIVSGSSNNFQVEYYTSLSDFDPGFWYKILLTGVIKDSVGQSLQDEYWTFKTGNGLCNPTSMSVDSNSDVLQLGQSQEYVANCFDSNCTICDDRYTYLWEIINPNVANFLVNNSTNTTTVRAIGAGTTKVKATNLSIGNLTGFANLRVVNNTGNSNSFAIRDHLPVGNNSCPNSIIKITFNNVIDTRTIQNKILLKDYSGKLVDTRSYSYINEDYDSVLVLEPISGLENDKSYRVDVLRGILSENGGVMEECNFSSDETCYSWEFKTADSVCSLNRINIISPVDKFYEFNSPDESFNFVVEEMDSMGNIIHPVQGIYDWRLGWESKDSNLVDIGSGSDSSSNSVPFVSKNKNGVTTLTVTASALDIPVGYTGPDLDDDARVEVFLCENPWTPLTDDEYNFSIKYCKDGNLPNLYIRSNTNASEGQLKEYILTFNPNTVSAGNGLNNSINKIVRLSNNSFILNIFSQIFGGITNKLFGTKVFASIEDYEQDVIGLRIYKNPKHFSPYYWYYKSNYISFKGSPQKTTVDSYSAIKDGTTTYVNAGNKVIHNLEENEENFDTYIYLISYNSNASVLTRGIVAQLINNWKFNTNINNFDEKVYLTQDVKRWEDIRTIESMLDGYAQKNKYCAYTSNPVNGSCSETADLSYTWRDDNGDGVIDNGECYNISSDIRCSSDEYCINHHLRFHKCTTRYPELNSGTYKKGVSISVWPSWRDTLSNQIGSSLPVDPVNKMGEGCYGDPVTCWDAIAGTSSCPQGSNIYYYKSKSGGGFEFYTLFNNNDINKWGGDNQTVNSYNAFFIDNSAVCNDIVSGCNTNNDCLGDCQICNMRTHECENKCRGNKPYCIDPVNKVCGQCNNNGIMNSQCTNPCETCNPTTHSCEFSCGENTPFCLNDTCVECVNDDDCSVSFPLMPRCVNNFCSQGNEETIDL